MHNINYKYHAVYRISQTVKGVIYMAKTISVDEFTYSNVVSMAGRLMMHTGKPVSLGFTILLGTITLERRLSMMNEKEIEMLKEGLKNITSPAQLDKEMDEWFTQLTGKEPQTDKPVSKSATTYIQ